ncbi:MAG: RNA-binding protein [Bacillota bacterium]
MNNREKLLSHVQDNQTKHQLARVIDLAEGVLERQVPDVTDFYDPYLIMLAEGILKRMPEVGFSFVGGYSEAERKRILIFPSNHVPSEINAKIALLVINPCGLNSSLKHRDYLGALLGLGIRREKIGDLLVEEAGCKAVVDQGVAVFIKGYLKQVGREIVSITEVSSNADFRSKEGIIKKGTVASLRLDAVASLGFGMSRNNVQREILAERFKVNWQLVKKPDFQLKEGDVISCRGRGRVIIIHLSGQTKKGRIGLLLEKYT